MFTIALVGRPNVGKSTFFNRLVGKKIAIVDNTPGVTRDRREGFCRFEDKYIRLYDTAGFEDETGESLSARMREQTECAIKEADLCLFVYDARTGLTALDKSFARFLRKNARKVMVIANKCESHAADAGLIEGQQLGFGDPFPISAEHGENVFLLMQSITQNPAYNIPDIQDVIGKNNDTSSESEEQDIEYAAAHDLDVTWVDAEGSVRVGTERPLRVCILGRPNAGKSTLINNILGENRLLTGAEAGITRDAIAVEYEHKGQKITFFDTAGIRKKANVQEKIEKLSVAESLRALQYSEVAIILLDAENALEKQDLQLIELCEKEGRAVIIAINKWDKVHNPSGFGEMIHEKIKRLLPQLKQVPIVFISGLSGRGIDKLFESIFFIYEHWNGRVSTSHLNKWLKLALQAHPTPLVNGKRLKLKYMTQIKTRPPTFVVFSSRGDKIPDSYKRYLLNSLREEFDFKGTPLRLEVRTPKNPYADKT